MVNDVPEGSPSFFPFLFITIACGAISGFHSLVASGTSSKQLDKEPDARYVGYMGAVGEGSLATGAVLAATAGVAASQADWHALYPDFATASGGAVGNFVNGVAEFANNLGIPLDIAAVFAAVVVISFAATTMDTGVRLQRYVIQEIGELLRHPGAGPQPHPRHHGRRRHPAGHGAAPGRRRGRLHLRRPVAAVRHHQPAHRRPGAVGDRGLGHPAGVEPGRDARPAGVPARR